MTTRARDHSALVRAWNTLDTRLRRAAADSRVARLLDAVRTLERRATEPFARAASTSRLRRAGATLKRYATASFTYRWLTAEPDPEVIVVDLRETVTVGPLIAVIDRLGRAIAPAARTSRTRSYWATFTDRLRARPLRVAGLAMLCLVAVSFATRLSGGRPGMASLAVHAVLTLVGLAAARSRVSWADLRSNVVGRALAAALEPPAPPDRPGEPEQSESGGRRPTDARCGETRPTDTRSRNEEPADDVSRDDRSG